MESVAETYFGNFSIHPSHTPTTSNIYLGHRKLFMRQYISPFLHTFF